MFFCATIVFSSSWKLEHKLWFALCFDKTVRVLCEKNVTVFKQ